MCCTICLYITKINDPRYSTVKIFCPISSPIISRYASATNATREQHINWCSNVLTCIIQIVQYLSECDNYKLSAKTTKRLTVWEENWENFKTKNSNLTLHHKFEINSIGPSVWDQSRFIKTLLSHFPLRSWLDFFFQGTIVSWQLRGSWFYPNRLAAHYTARTHSTNRQINI